MKIQRRIFVIFVIVFLLLQNICTFSLAHSGRTDSKGGHTNHSTGEYHYHHGYPAHQHTGGKCPYEFDDKTAKNSGSSSSGLTIQKKQEQEKDNKEEKSFVIVLLYGIGKILLGLFISFISFMLIISIFYYFCIIIRFIYEFIVEVIRKLFKK